MRLQTCDFVQVPSAIYGLHRRTILAQVLILDRYSGLHAESACMLENLLIDCRHFVFRVNRFGPLTSPA